MLSGVRDMPTDIVNCLFFFFFLRSNSRPVGEREIALRKLAKRHAELCFVAGLQVQKYADVTYVR